MRAGNVKDRFSSSRQSAAGTPFGYHGGYLRVDLSTGRSNAIPLSEQVLRRFLGGTGLGVYLMLREAQAEVEPLSPSSALAIVFSPLVGSPLTTSAKFAVVSKSPLTNRYNDSLASSGFAVAGKKAGWDAIVITGRASEPSVLVIDDDRIEMRAAGDLWGLTVREAEAMLRDQMDSSFRFAVIGPAGERQVRYATVSHDGRHAGRGGSGAILGAKNLKAIAVRGTMACQWAQPEALAGLSKTLSQRSFGPATAKYRELGTATNLLTFNRMKTLPTRNFQRGSFSGAEQIAPETLAQARDKTRQSCVACTIGCEHVYGINKSKDSVRLEYENLFSLGSLCEVEDSEAVLQASRLCDDLGMDTISSGGTIAFAMECVERGVLKEPWLKFGDGDALLQALSMIGNRDGLGTYLAEGSLRLAQRLGPETMAWAAQVKGLEMPGYEPRGLHTMALGFAVSSRGADHNRSGAYEADFSDRVDRRQGDSRSVQWAIRMENQAALLDSLILCKFLRGVFTDVYDESANMLRLVTGWDYTVDELQQTAVRIVTAKKLFNIHAGWTPEEDTLPDRFLETPLEDDPQSTLTRDRLNDLVRQYYLQRGWTSRGELTADVLEEVGLIEFLKAESKTR